VPLLCSQSSDSPSRRSSDQPGYVG
jgi:hypothetical protein